METNPAEQANLSLGEVASRFLASLSDQEREVSQQDVNRFVRWFGWDRPVVDLTIPQVGSYAEQIAAAGADSVKKLEPVRAFLAFAKKSGFTRTNLSLHLRVRNITSARTVQGRRPHRDRSLTEQGYQKLKQELESLKRERPQVQEEISRAAADKDVRENAPLEAARERHGMLESRIQELEGILTSARVMRASEPKATAFQGNTVTLIDLELAEPVRYTLVDPREVDPAKGKISVASPVGKAVLGRGVGEMVEVAAPAGKIRYRIEKIEP